MDDGIDNARSPGSGFEGVGGGDDDMGINSIAFTDSDGLLDVLSAPPEDETPRSDLMNRHVAWREVSVRGGRLEDPELGVMTSLDALGLMSMSIPNDEDDALDDQETSTPRVKRRAAPDVKPPTLPAGMAPPPLPPRELRVSQLLPAPTLPSPQSDQAKRDKLQKSGKQKSFFRPKKENLVFFTPFVADDEKKYLVLVDPDSLQENVTGNNDFDSILVQADITAVQTLLDDRRPPPGLTVPLSPASEVLGVMSSSSSEAVIGESESLPSSTESPRMSGGSSDLQSSEGGDWETGKELTDAAKRRSSEVSKRASLELESPGGEGSGKEKEKEPVCPVALSHPLDEEGLLFVPSNTNAEASGGRPLIKAGTVTKLVERLSHEKYPDPVYLACFLITYRTFMKPDELLELLIRRFNLEPPSTATSEEIIIFKGKTLFPIRLRIFNVFKHWTEKHVQDFDENPALVERYKTFVMETVAGSGDMFQKLAVQLLDIINRHEKKKAAEAKPAWLRELSASWAEEYVSPSASGGPASVQHISFSNTVVEAEADDDVLDVEEGPSTATTTETSGEAAPAAPGIPNAHLQGGGEILKYDSVDLARYITNIELKILRKIKSSEFVKNRWQKKNKETVSPNILTSIQRFNDVCTWVTSEVVKADDAKVRVQVICKFIAVAKECFAIGNFNSLFQIVTGLQYRPCRRLTRTWDEVPNRSLKDLTELSDLMSSVGNFANYRVRLKMRNPPGIPYLGLLLKDLVFAEDGSPDYTGDGLVNFVKMRQIAQLMLHFFKYVDVPYPNWTFSRPVVIFCENMSLLSDAEIAECSFRIEPRKVIK